MRNARGHNKKKMKMSGSEKKVNKKRYDISSKERVTSRVSGSFTLKSCKTTAKKCTKKCAARAKLFFFGFNVNVRPIIVFSPFSLPLPLSITRFCILFEQTMNINKNFAFSPG